LLIDEDYPIRLCVIQKDLGGNLQVVGVGTFDWRKVLVNRRVSTLVELNDPLNPEMTAGVLDVALELHPPEHLREDEFEFHIKQKQRKEEELNSEFFLKAKHWWNDFLQIRDSHSSRLVKIFGANEFGDRLPVTRLLQPISCIVL
jgi:centrosomal protein CEP76